MGPNIDSIVVQDCSRIQIGRSEGLPTCLELIMDVCPRSRRAAPGLEQPRMDGPRAGNISLAFQDLQGGWGKRAGGLTCD